MADISDILGYLDSPEGKAMMAAHDRRTAKYPRVIVTVPEGLVGQFTKEYEFLAAKNSPWVRDCGAASEAALVHRLVAARECALRVSDVQCRALYKEKARLACQKSPLTEVERDRLHELNTVPAEHPISMNLDIVMLIVDHRLDSCGYPVADWLPLHIEHQLAEWRSEVGEAYGTAWVDEALRGES